MTMSDENLSDNDFMASFGFIEDDFREAREKDLIVGGHGGRETG